MGKILFTVLYVLFLMNNIASAVENDVIEIESEGGYRIAAGASIDLPKKMALFIAKRKAVDLAARYLSHKSLIAVYELNQEEIYSLAAREIRAEILTEKQETVGKTPTYRVRIRAWIEPADFVKAEIEDAKQEKIEADQSYREEMEQQVPAETDPGKDIAKAYRLLREKKWRIAMIYLNHLERKYPDWDSVYMAKAITHYILHELVFMKKALNRACQLGNPIACDDITHLKRVHELDFGLSIVE
jgi:hypothetical protein